MDNILFFFTDVLPYIVVAFDVIVLFVMLFLFVMTLINDVDNSDIDFFNK